MSDKAEIKPIYEDLSTYLENNLQINIIHNRFDILYEDYHLIAVDGVAVPYIINNREVKAGLYLTALSDSQMTALSKYIFSQHPQVESISVSHSYTPIPFCVPEIYWHIALPSTIEDFNKTLSSKLRYNVKWYPKKLAKEKGEVCFRHYDATEVPEQLIRLYFEWKQQSHNYSTEYAPQEFIKRFGITSVYELTVGKAPVAVGFSCETGEVSYFENFSYHPEYHLYSPGMILYHNIISHLISKGITYMYLSGGDLDYKRRYNGIRTETYTGRIFRKDNKLKLAINVVTYFKLYRLGEKTIKLIASVLLRKEYRRTFRMFIEKQFIKRF